MSHRHKKSLGQHFLHDQALLQDIVGEIQPQNDERLIEIGPGEGVLSHRLSHLCCSLSLIELDHRLVSKLNHDFAKQDSVRVIQADALKYDYADLTNEECRIVGNLPYNISSQLILRFLKLKNVSEMYFVIQRELAQRLCAQPGASDYGRFSLMTQIHCQAEQVFDLPPEAFDPAPKVWSSLVRLSVTPSLMSDAEQQIFANVVRQAFSQRRKQVANSLNKVISPDQLEQLNINPSLRAQNLTMSDYEKISKRLSKERQGDKHD